MTSDSVEIKKGLRDVFLDGTLLSFIDGRAGELYYYGYNIHDIAENASFEEVAYLMLNGKLPTNSELTRFEDNLKTNRFLPENIISVIESISNSHPMDVLRTTISAMSESDSNLLDNSKDSVLKKSIRLIAAVPTIVATHSRIRENKKPVLPNAELSHAANFLYMLTDEIPDKEDSDLIDKDLVLHCEHGLNASTFSARLTASTNADFYACITSALATLKGPLHGGAAEAVMTMANEVGEPENAEKYVENVINNGGRIMGFGHAIYRAIDPRSIHIRAEAEALCNRRGNPKWFSILQAITESKPMKSRSRHGLHPNVDFWAGVIYNLLGIPEDLYVPLFAVGRMPGWSAHIIEQHSQSQLIRPRLQYTGELNIPFVKIEDRN